MDTRARFLAVMNFEPVDRTLLWEDGYWLGAVRHQAGGEISRTLDGQRFMHFDIQAPFPPQPGAHWSQRLFHGPNQPPQSVHMSVSERAGLCR